MELISDLNKNEVVRDYDIRLSQLVLGLGLNLRCMLPEYSQTDYRKACEDVNITSREGVIVDLNNPTLGVAPIHMNQSL